MTAAFVLDASVVGALYVEEPLSEDVRAMLERLTGGDASLHAPELLLYDAAYVALAGVLGGVVVTADRRLREIGTSAGLPVASVAEV